MTFIFLGGFFSSNTKFEQISEYVTDVATNKTRNKPLCALTVGSTEDSGSIPNPDSEFHNTYGTFMQQRIAFASAVNPDKEMLINFEGIQSNNLSLLYGGAVGSIPYDEHFKHNTLPIELMFSDERMYDISNYVIYISQEHADRILDSYNLPRQEDGFHTAIEYNSLLKQPISVSIDGVLSDFIIQNIYYQFNYYYEGLSEVMGDFVIFSYYLPGNLRAEQRNIYFMDEYVYHNKYFMNYIISSYPSRSYSLKINHYNLTEQIDEDFFLSFYYSKNINNFDWVNTTFVTVAILLLLSSLSLEFFIDSVKKKPVFWSILHLGVLFVPYFVFSTIYRFTGNIYFLPEAASKTNMFVILIYSFIYVMILVYGSRFFTKKNIYEKDYYEVFI